MAQTLTMSELKTALAELQRDLEAKIDRLDVKIDGVRSELSEQIARVDGKVDGFRQDLVGSIRDLNAQFLQSQAEQNARLDRIGGQLEEADAKISAIMEMLATRKEVRALVRELKAQGIKLEESRIFAA